MESSVTRLPGRDWRRIAFFAVVVLSILIFGLFFGGVLALGAPLVSPGEGPGYDFPEMHRWHDTQWGAFIGIMIVGSLVSLLRKPERKPLIVQFLVVTIAIFMLLSLIISNFDNLIMLIPIALVATLYPARDRLASLDVHRGWNLPLLIMTAAVVVVLVPEAWDKLQLQFDHAPGDEHAEFGHWAGSAFLLIGYAVAGVLAATGRAGCRYIGSLAGISLIYLGFGALVMPDDKGIVATWGATAALLSILAGIAFIGATLAGDRLRTLGPSQSQPAAAGN